MARGDHIFVHRLGYTHHGIEAGDGTVIHYTGEIGRKTNAEICRTPIDEFANGCDVQARIYGKCDEPDRVIERASGRLGEASYHLVFNNCEHFATWCKTGRHQSEQVTDLTGTGVGAVSTGAAIAAGIGTVSAAGSAAGLSGAGIMSGLASIGGVVGGGAVAGIAVLGAGPAVITSSAMFYVLKDDPIFHEPERSARTFGRLATCAGAAGGTVASVSAVAMAGSVAGLSAAGISSGLAVIGGTIGGGMAAGVAITAAAPAVTAAAVGYGAYRIWKRFRKGNSKPKHDGIEESDRSDDKSGDLSGSS